MKLILTILLTGCSTGVTYTDVPLETDVSEYSTPRTTKALDYADHLSHLEELQTKHNLPGLDYDRLSLVEVEIVDISELRQYGDDLCGVYRHTQIKSTGVEKHTILMPTANSLPDTCPDWDLVLVHELAHAAWQHNVPEMGHEHTHAAWGDLR